MKWIMIYFLLNTALMFIACRSENSPLSSEVPQNIDSVVSSNNIKRKPVLMMPKTRRMMDENTFWQLIENAKNLHPDLEHRADYLQYELEQMPAEDIISFRLRIDQLMAASYDAELWCAAYIILRGASDEAFEFFRLWLIAQGKASFYHAKQKPDELINMVSKSEDCSFEPLWYVANNAFEAKTGAVLFDYIDDDFTNNEGYYAPINFNWQEDNPASMQQICPRLFGRFMH